MKGTGKRKKAGGRAAARRVLLISAAADEAARRIASLSAAGWRVDHDPLSPASMKAMRAAPPDAFVVDLTRAPSQGRDFALWARGAKTLRGVPIVFAGGEAQKVARIRRQLPDAGFCTWRGVRSALRKAIARPPAAPVNPGSLAGYSGTPLPKKLGIKEGSIVGLIGAPGDFRKTLGAIPAGAILKRAPRAACDLVIWFTRRRKDLERIRIVAAKARDGLWIAWPKQASGVKTDIREGDVRGAGLANELVDYKIAAIDATWSGLKFAHRPTRRGR